MQYVFAYMECAISICYTVSEVRYMLFAVRLKELRKDKGLTQDDMAEFLCIKRQTYSAYERQISLPDINILYKLSEFFGVSLDYLIGKSEKKTSTNNDGSNNKFSDDIESLSPESQQKAKEYIEMLKTLDKLKPKEQSGDIHKNA
jgi:transcriptional regulator with XRE-family HTH domain